MKYSLTLIACLFSFFPVTAQQVDTTYIWPTSASPYLSSTFGETRSAHFHAGLDIKTWGREGYRVFASRDGILHRLIITNQGYGKAIYLKHNDGTYTVYAHLQRFIESFQHIADSVRMLDFDYEMDILLEPRNMAVKQGQIIGFSGSTGVGPPHLHFEIRDIHNNPINPLRSNLTVEDTTPPLFRSLMIEPLSVDASINQNKTPVVVNPISSESGAFDFGEVSVAGAIGISVNVFDQSDKVTNRYAVHELLLLSENDTLYHEQINIFDFDQSEQMFLNRVPAPGSSRRSFQRLFLKNGSDHPFIIRNKEFSKGNFLSAYKIIARDFYGNEAMATIKFYPDLNIPFVSLKEVYDSLDFFKNGYWTEEWISRDSLVFDLTSPTYENFWVNDKSKLKRISPEKKYDFYTPDFRLRTLFSEETFFDTLSILSTYSISDDTAKIRLIHPSLPSRKSFGIQFYLGDVWKDSSNFHLYEFDPIKESYSFVESYVNGRTLTAFPSKLGEFTILSDTTAPEIAKPTLVSSLGSNKSYQIQIFDNLSGINPKSAIFKINGVRGIPEYDFESDTFTYYHPSFKPEKKNTIYFEVKDNAGNKAIATFSM